MALTACCLIIIIFAVVAEWNSPDAIDELLGKGRR